MLRMIAALIFVVVSWILLAATLIFAISGTLVALGTWYVWLLTVTDPATARMTWWFGFTVACVCALLCAARVAYILGLSGPMPGPDGRPVARPSPPRSGPIGSGAPSGPDGHLWEKDRPSPEEIARRGGVRNG